MCGVRRAVGAACGDKCGVSVGWHCPGHHGHHPSPLDVGPFPPHGPALGCILACICSVSQLTAREGLTPDVPLYWVGSSQLGTVPAWLAPVLGFEMCHEVCGQFNQGGSLHARGSIPIGTKVLPQCCSVVGITPWAHSPSSSQSSPVGTVPGSHKQPDWDSRL